MSKIFKGSCDIAAQLASQIQANSGASCTVENMTALTPGGKGIEQMSAEFVVRSAEPGIWNSAIRIPHSNDLPAFQSFGHGVTSGAVLNPDAQRLH
jgi:hypothetical protein